MPTWASFLYLAIVLDVWSRRIVGWAMAHHLKTALVLDALEMALSQRRPESVIHHSDRDRQFALYEPVGGIGARNADSGTLAYVSMARTFYLARRTQRTPFG